MKVFVSALFILIESIDSSYLQIGLVAIKSTKISLASLIAFYKGERGDEKYVVKDDQSVLDFFASQWAEGDASSVVKATLKNTAFWGTDLTQFEGLEETVTNSLESIITNGMKATLEAFVK